jgi:hypothetical protein
MCWNGQGTTVPEQEDSEFIYSFWKFGEEKLIHTQAQKVVRAFPK